MSLIRPGAIGNFELLDAKFKTNFATKPDPEEDDGAASEIQDPMEGMVDLPGGGYNLQKFITMERSDNSSIMLKQSNLDFK